MRDYFIRLSCGIAVIVFIFCIADSFNISWLQEGHPNRNFFILPIAFFIGWIGSYIFNKNKAKEEFKGHLKNEYEDNKELIEAHVYSSFNRKSLERDNICGCFYCLEIFNPNEIEEWEGEKEDTAFCPYCGIDSIIGESSGFPITQNFLREMNQKWFH